MLNLLYWSNSSELLLHFCIKWIIIKHSIYISSKILLHFCVKWVIMQDKLGYMLIFLFPVSSILGLFKSVMIFLMMNCINIKRFKNQFIWNIITLLYKINYYKRFNNQLIRKYYYITWWWWCVWLILRTSVIRFSDELDLESCMISYFAEKFNILMFFDDISFQVFF